MKIAVNMRLVVKDKFCGISWFAYESLQRITRNHPKHEFLFLFDRPYSEEYVFGDNVTPLVVGPPTRHPILWHWWNYFSVPKTLKRHKPDVFLSPDGFLPFNTSVKTLNIIHDVGFEHHKENLPFLERMYYRKYFSKFARKSTRLATISQFSKADIIKTYGLPSEKIDVVYDGVNENFKPITPEQQKEIQKKYSGGNEYFISVGRLHTRKNTHLLLEAFDSFKSSFPSSIKLVIVGNQKWQSKQVKDVFDKLKFKDDIIFTGRISDISLAQIMGASLSLVFVPYYEGFALAPIEAMSSDVPVICLKSTSMPEIVGEAALYVDMKSNSIKEGMIKMYKNIGLRKDLVNKGRQQRLLYSWDKTAENIWDSITKTVSSELN